MRIGFTGNGERHVRLGYVVETPIWKTSYRLILSDSTNKAAATTRPALADGELQGWAIVENQTDNDWNNVQLSLVSGRPISFVENLYQPLYINRPIVEPELFASLRPQVYAGGDKDDVLDMKQALRAPAPIAAMHGMKTQRVLHDEAQNGAAGASDAGFNPSASVASIASAANVGELFEYTIGSVTLPRQRSAMLPIITDPIEVERVSIYNQAVMARNPLNGARVKNTTKKHLLAGPITVLDGATYAGDAQIDNLPPGQERFLSYGVDLQMSVDAKNNHQDNQIQTGKIVKGVLYLTHKLVQTQAYEADNKSDRDKVLIIEHPRNAGWDLVDSPTPMEKTDAEYRFRQSIASGKTETVTVKEQLVQDETIAILNSEADALDLYRQQGAIPKPVTDALTKAIKLKQAMVDTQRQIDADKSHLSDITTEQNRIRDNMRAVQETSKYYTRLTTKLNDQETEIEKTQTAVDDLQKQLDSQRADFENYVQNLNAS